MSMNEKNEHNSRIIHTVGRRKTSVARIRLFPDALGNVTINNRPLNQFFPQPFHQKIVQSPFLALKSEMSAEQSFGVSVRVVGGGVRGQAESIRHGISRALVSYDPLFRKTLKKNGFLTRDPRMKERKKPGLKRARRAPQWSKR